MPKPFDSDRLKAEKNRKETKLAMLKAEFTSMTQYEKDLEYIAEFQNVNGIPEPEQPEDIL